MEPLEQVLLKQFYRELQAWIENGRPEDHPVFKQVYGVCDQLSKYLYKQVSQSKLYVRVNVDEMMILLVNSFKESELNGVYPFNKGNPDRFLEEMDTGTLYQNPLRLDWIAEHAAS